MKLLYSLLITFSFISSLSAYSHDGSCSYDVDDIFVPTGQVVQTSGLSTNGYISNNMSCKVTNGNIAYLATDCTHPAYYPTSKFDCTISVYEITSDYTCPVGQIPENNICVTPPPECTLPMVLNSSNDACVLPDKCNPEHADYLTSDCNDDGIPNKDDPTADNDNDGDPNGTDPDIDGDGTANESDADPLDADNAQQCSNIADNERLVSNVSHAQCLTSNPLFIVPDEYTWYYYKAEFDTCRNLCVVSKVNCPRGESTINGKCEEPDPDYTQCLGTVEAQPIQYGLFVGRQDGKVAGCTKDFICKENSHSIGYLFKTVDVSCEDDKPDEDEEPDLTNFDEENDIEDPLSDSNGTVQTDTAESFKAALESYGSAKEVTQKKMGLELEKQTQLQKEDKTIQDGILNKLGELKRVSEGIISSNSANTLKINTKLDSLNQTNSNINTKLTTLDLNEKVTNSKLEDGLFGDDPFANTDFTDGSDTFNQLGDTAKNSFNVTTESNIFGLANSSGASIPTFSVQMMGRTITIFEPSMLTGLPIDDMRALILFMFALMGFAHTFRSI